MNKQLIAVAALVAFAASSQAAVTNTVSFKLKATVQVADTVKTNGSGVVTETYKTKSYKIVNADLTGDKKAKIYAVDGDFWFGTNALPMTIKDYADVEEGNWSHDKSNVKATSFTQFSYDKGATNKNTKFDIYGLADWKGAESKNKQAESTSFKGTGYGTYLGQEAIIEGSASASGSLKKTGSSNK